MRFSVSKIEDVAKHHNIPKVQNSKKNNDLKLVMALVVFNDV